MKLDYSDIIESDSEDGEVRLLVEPRQTAGGGITGYLGFTLNHPRTVKFLNASSQQQKNIYTKWYNSFKNTFAFDSESVMVFEYCKTGQVHCHGYITMKGNYFTNGAVSDLTKAILKFLPSKYNKFNENFLFDKFNRYRCPSIVVQHYTPNEDDNTISGIKHWKAYINKCVQ